MIQLLSKFTMNEFALRDNHSGIDYFHTSKFVLESEMIKRSFVEKFKVDPSNRDLVIKKLVAEFMHKFHTRLVLSSIVFTMTLILYILIKINFGE